MNKILTLMGLATALVLSPVSADELKNSLTNMLNKPETTGSGMVDLGGINLHGIDWAIAGGESGPGARSMQPNWVRSIRDQCIRDGVAFHFKQWGGVNKKRTGRVLDGRTWDEFPVAAVA